MANSKIETKIKYYDEIEIVFNRERIIGSPYMRIDYHEDGSSSYYYGIEFNAKEWDKMGLVQAWKTKEE